MSPLADPAVLKTVALCALGAGATVAAILAAYLWAEQKLLALIHDWRV